MQLTWQYGLLAFAVLWALQIAGTAFQMRHYQAVLAGLAGRWNDGFIGTGNAHARFGRGVIAILVVGPAGIVREALVMQGRTVLAKFHPLPELAGRSLDEVRGGAMFGRDRARLATAFGRCVEQVDRIAAERRGATAQAA